MTIDLVHALETSPAKAHFPELMPSDAEKTLLAALQTAYPQNGVRFVKATPVSGLYQVILGTNVSFVMVDSTALTTLASHPIENANDPRKETLFRYWIFGGVLYDMASHTDLSEDLKRMANTVDVKRLPLDQAIKRVKGNGRETLYVFTDPLCPFCQTLEKTLEDMSDVTIYTFLTPLVSLHPKARDLSARIWCSMNQEKALREAMLKDKAHTLPPANCTTPILKNEALMGTLGIKGTPSVVYADGHRTTGALTLEALKEEMKDAQAMLKAARELTESTPTQH